jgi:hypothetical protein
LNAIPENADTEEKKKPRNILAVIWVSDLSEAELQTMDQVIEHAINMHITPSATSE